MVSDILVQRSFLLYPDSSATYVEPWLRTPSYFEASDDTLSYNRITSFFKLNLLCAVFVLLSYFVYRPSMSAISIPSRAKHTASVIFAHGLGDSGAGWSFLPELMAAQNALAGVKWILPNAPNSPVTINGGMKMPSWYDIQSLTDINRASLSVLLSFMR